MTWLYPVVGLLFLILVHEAGHFLVAKATGARATRFYVGFPPAILRRTWRGTEYGLGAIPLGGYVRIVGMTRPQGTDLYRVVDAADEARLRRDPDRRDELTPAVEALRARLDAGDLDGARPLAATVATALDGDRDLLQERTAAQAARDVARLAEDLDPRAYWRLAVWRRIAIIAAGPAANLVAAVVILTLYFASGVPVHDVTRSVDTVAPGTPAATAGLRPGDAIVAVNGAAVDEAADVSRRIQAADGGTVRVRVLRGGAPVDLAPVEPRRQDGRWVLGFNLDTERTGTETYGPVAAVERSLDTVVEVTRATGTALKDIVVGEGRENLTTPVGIVSQSEPTVEEGAFPGVLALISLALAIFNLLPFLPLDGGHIVFALAERLRGGRPVPRAVYERVSLVGIALMLVLFFFGITNDIERLSQP